MVRLSCITKNGTNPAYEGARIGASRVATALGCAIRHYFPAVPDNVDEQAGLIGKALKDGTDAVLLAATHPTALDGAIKEVIAAGIPMIYFVSRSSAVEGQSFVTADNYTLARAIADYLIDDLGGGGDFVLVEGSPNSETSGPRTQGFLDAVAAHPHARIAARCCGNYQRDDARAAMRELLPGLARVDGVLSANDYMAFGVMDALAEKGDCSAIIGINAMPQAIAAIKAVRMRATVAFDAMKMCAIATEAAIRTVRGQAVPALIELPAEIVDASNCALWDLPYDQRPLPDWERVVGG